jgi:hypothetical protein
MALSRQTRNYIIWAALQIAVLVGIAWWAERQAALGPTDAKGWRPFAWPLFEQDVPTGRAYSGDDHDIYVWLKLRDGDCPQGIATDDALEREVDIRWLDPRFEPVGPGERVRVTDLFGWARVYVHRRNNRSLRYGEAVVIAHNCDIIAAIIDGDARDPAMRRTAREFLESNTVQIWILKKLEER